MIGGAVDKKINSESATPYTSNDWIDDIDETEKLGGTNAGIRCSLWTKAESTLKICSFTCMFTFLNHLMGGFVK